MPLEPRVRNTPRPSAPAGCASKTVASMPAFAGPWRSPGRRCRRRSTRAVRVGVMSGFLSSGAGSPWKPAHCGPQPVSGWVICATKRSTNDDSASSSASRYSSSTRNSGCTPPATVASIERADLGALPASRRSRRSSSATTSLGGSAAISDERGHEVRVLVLRHLDQLPQPVAQLPPAGVGQRVHRALRALARAGGLLLGDQARPWPAAHDHVERAVVEADAALVAVLAQGPAQLVRVHRPAGEIGQHRERQQVADLAFRCSRH